MQVAVTGATGFLGRYIVERLIQAGHKCRCWHRPSSDRTGVETWGASVEWQPGAIGDAKAASALVRGCQVLVHAALDYPQTTGSMSGRSFTVEHACHNIQGALQLFEAARAAGVERVVFISSCAVYEKILPDRPLDETHPLWPGSDYGAHKAAIEAFIHSYATAEKFPICALRPTGIYGLAHPVEHSKWYDVVAAVVRGETVTCRRGGKEVHAADVAKSVELLLQAPAIAGEAFNCYDRYVSEYDVAILAKAISTSSARIEGEPMQPKHQIVTGKIRTLGMRFGGDALLETTVAGLVAFVRRQDAAGRAS